MKKLLCVLVTVFTLCMFSTVAYAADSEAYAFWDESSATLTLVASDSGVPEGDYGELLGGGALPTDADDMFDWPWFQPGLGGKAEAVVIDSSMADYTGFNSTAYMFSDFYHEMPSLDLSNLNTENVSDMSHMFENCSVLELDVSGLDTSNVSDMSYMFENCGNLFELDVSGFDTSEVTDMSYMFKGCTFIPEFDVSGFDTSNVTDMSHMFENCEYLTDLDVSGFDTSNVTNMHCMFGSCHQLTELDVSGFDTSNVTDMYSLFSACNNLESIDVSGFDTSNVERMESMFQSCKALTSIDISSFDTSNVNSIDYMFYQCDDLETIYCAAGTDWSGIGGRNVFTRDTNLVGGNGTTFDGGNTDAEYARFDSSEAPGYFTALPGSAFAGSVLSEGNVVVIAAVAVAAVAAVAVLVISKKRKKA